MAQPPTHALMLRDLQLGLEHENRLSKRSEIILTEFYCANILHMTPRRIKLDIIGTIYRQPFRLS